MTLSESQRREVLSKVLQTIDRQFMGAEPDTERLRQEHESAIIDSADTDQFETAMSALLKALGSSHVGFFHDGRPRAAGRVAIAATFMKTDTPDVLRCGGRLLLIDYAGDPRKRSGLIAQHGAHGRFDLHDVRDVLSEEGFETIDGGRLDWLSLHFLRATKQ